MRARKVIFWLHLVAGAIAGTVVLIMSVTGVLLMYEKQIVEWLNNRKYRVERPVSGAARMPVEALLGRIGEQRSALPSSLVAWSDPSAPVEAVYGREESAYVDPYTGEILGDGSPRVRRFFRAVTDWHRWLGAAGERRETGKAITGACNLAFLFLVVSGGYLWLPRAWSRAGVRSVAWFRRGQRGRARDFNWHNVIGLWCAAPLFLIVMGAALISYPWATDLLYRAMGSEPPARPAVRTAQAGAPPFSANLRGLNERWARAEAYAPGWRSISLRLPVAEAAPAVFTIFEGHAGQPQKRITLSVGRSGNIVQSERFSDLPAAQRVRTWFRFVHTGEYYGLAGQTVAGIASAGAVMLVYTGFSLALRRFRAWTSRRRSERGEERLEEAGIAAGPGS
ncbi:MAG: PepSY domain-containing protein [Bryobacteraceae bacterium]|nr:PepSY domain-containing protein [Bryobacteraceae bacterium]